MRWAAANAADIHLFMIHNASVKLVATQLPQADVIVDLGGAAGSLYDMGYPCDVAAAIESLARDPCAPARMGEAARRYVETTLDGARIARRFQRAIESNIKRPAQNSLVFDSSSGKGVELAADMLRRSLTRAVPEHLPKYFP